MLSLYGEHIAAIVIGPYDLSISLGVCEQFESPEFLGAVERVFDVCKRSGVSYGIFCDGREQAEKWRDEGANFLWICTEEQLIKAAMKQEIKPLADI